MSLYFVGKSVEILGMSVALWALVAGVELQSMDKEFGYLFLAGVTFYIGWLIEKKAAR